MDPSIGFATRKNLCQVLRYSSDLIAQIATDPIQGSRDSEKWTRVSYSPTPKTFVKFYGILWFWSLGSKCQICSYGISDIPAFVVLVTNFCRLHFSRRFVDKFWQFFQKMKKCHKLRLKRRWKYSTFSLGDISPQTPVYTGGLYFRRRFGPLFWQFFKVEKVP